MMGLSHGPVPIRNHHSSARAIACSELQPPEQGADFLSGSHLTSSVGTMCGSCPGRVIGPRS